jgi:hypothetical protein
MLCSMHGMTSQPAIYESLPDVDDDLDTEFDSEAEAFNPIRGMLVGIALCAPVWAALYWMFRSIWG